MKNRKREKRFFFDMDGVLAVFNFEATQEDLRTDNYWINRPYHFNMILLVFLLILLGYDVYIITATLEDHPKAITEKNGWLNILLPMISSDKRIFTICGDDKIASVPEFNPETDILVDDYGVNCLAWEKAGGTYVKVSVNKEDAEREAAKHRYVIHPDMSPYDAARILTAI